MDWSAEISEVHAIFHAWFRDGSGSLDRFEATLDPSFTIISPSGAVASATEIIEAVRSGAGRAPGLLITTSEHELLASGSEFVVARYVEEQRTPEVVTRRRSTVVFRRDPAAVNGLCWLTVHETWLDHPHRHE